MSFDIIDRLEEEKQQAAATFREKTTSLDAELTKQFEEADYPGKLKLFLHLADKKIIAWDYIKKYGAALLWNMRYETCQKRGVDVQIREFKNLSEYEQELAQHEGDLQTQFYILSDMEATNMMNAFQKQPYMDHLPITNRYPELVAYAKRMRDTGLFN